MPKTAKTQVKGRKKGAVAAAKAKKPRSPRCRTCGKAIRIPEGWSVGPAVRRHYWAKHRDVMSQESKKR